MKSFKRLFSFVMVFVMVLTLLVPVAAGAEGSPLVSESHFTVVDNYITKVPAGTTKDEMLTNFPSGSEINSADEVASTGDVVKVSGTEYTLVVLADINGDGNVNSSDYMLVKGVFRNTISLTDAKLKAADINEDGRVSSADYMKVKKHIAGDLNLYRYMNKLPDWEGPHVKKLTIGGTDISNYVIIKPDNADAPETLAVNDLQKYIKLATGIELEIKDESSSNEYEICVGSTSRDIKAVEDARATLTNNGYSIVCKDGTVYLSGDNSTGTMYAVYSFLEDYVGCRFYSSKYDTVKYALKKDIPGNLTVTDSPYFFGRDTSWYDMFNEEFAVKLKINGGEGRNMTGLGENISYGGGAFVHTIGPFYGINGGLPNPCLTDQQVFDKVLDSVLDALRRKPDADIISISQNDNLEYCKCENCSAIAEAEGTQTGVLLTFVNKIAEEVEKEFPDVYVDTLAYQYSRQLPKTVRPRENVIIRLCTTDCCFSHPLNDESCAENAQFRKDLADWSSVCNNMYIWDYSMNYIFYNAPYPNFNVLRENMRYFADNNVIGMYEQGNFLSYTGDCEELRAYLLAKLLWDPYMSEKEYQAIMDDFLEGYYGDGWMYIREYIDTMCDMAADNYMTYKTNVKDFITLDSFSTTKEKKTFIEYLESSWANALALADEEHYEHVEKSSIQGTYARLMINWTTKDGPPRFEKLYNLLVKYNITHLSEGQKIEGPPGTFSQPLLNWHWFK